MNLLKELKTDWNESIRLSEMIFDLDRQIKNLQRSELPNNSSIKEKINVLENKSHELFDERRKIIEKWGLNQSII